MAAEQPLDSLATGPLRKHPSPPHFSFAVSAFPPRPNLGFAGVRAGSPVDFQYAVNPSLFGSLAAYSDDPDTECSRFALKIPQFLDLPEILARQGL